MDHVLKLIDSLLEKDRVKDARAVINSLNDNQLENKEWLLKESIEYINRFEDPRICIAGGWFGLTGQLFYEQGFDYIQSIDIDPVCKELGFKLHPNVGYITADINDRKIRNYDIMVCTACEHIDDNTIKRFVTERKHGGLLILQSNNYFGIDGHINCKNNLQEFVDLIDCNILKALELHIDRGGVKYTRFMVIAGLDENKHRN